MSIPLFDLLPQRHCCLGFGLSNSTSNPQAGLRFD
jgi:hypothetical protein